MSPTAAPAQDWSAVLIEYAVRDWLRTQPKLRAMVPFQSGVPDRLDVDYDGDSDTFLTLFRAGGSPRPTLGWDQAFLSFHCYGSTRHVAAKLEVELVRSLLSLKETPLTDSVHGVGAAVESRSYEPETGPGPEGTSTTHPRFIVTSLVTSHAIL